LISQVKGGKTMGWYGVEETAAFLEFIKRLLRLA
jgi:hypothetical protein